MHLGFGELKSGQHKVSCQTVKSQTSFATSLKFMICDFRWKICNNSDFVQIPSVLWLCESFSLNRVCENSDDLPIYETPKLDRLGRIRQISYDLRFCGPLVDVSAIATKLCRMCETKFRNCAELTEFAKSHTIYDFADLSPMCLRFRRNFAEGAKQSSEIAPNWPNSRNLIRFTILQTSLRCTSDFDETSPI